MATVIRHHHERVDGHGYPDGLKGNAIPVSSRIIGIADAFEAMTADRSYRRNLGRAAALTELAAAAGAQFDVMLVRGFLKVVAERPDL